MVSEAKPVHAADTLLRRKIINWSSQQLGHTAYSKVKAHPAAAVFPGTSASPAVWVDKQVHVQHRKIADSAAGLFVRMVFAASWAPNLYSTGLYALPGEYIEVTLPDSLVKRGIGVQIGIHSDNLSEGGAATENWRRMPLVVKHAIIDKHTIRIASPFGGLIYFSSRADSSSWEGDISVSHAIEAPLYVAGVTTQQEWAQQLQQRKAPWGELVGNNVIVTLPDSLLQQIAAPEKVMQVWEQIVTGEAELAQVPLPFYRPLRMVPDVHISWGYMHSGYPIMITHSPIAQMSSAEVMMQPSLLLKPSGGGANWGFFHEIGHNLQNYDWVFDGTTEVSCNFFTLYLFDRLVGGRDSAHTDISNAYTKRAIKEYFARGTDYELWKQEPFLGLILFRQLQEAFGWEAFKAFFRKMQVLALANREYTDAEKRDMWALHFSKITGFNLVPFFEKWGVPVGDTVKQQLQQLPVWMPYNFPPLD